MNMVNIKTIWIAAFIGAAGIAIGTGCSKDNAQDLFQNEECDTNQVTYSGAILPIIQSKCAVSGCHVNGSSSGHDFTTYDGLLAVVQDGKLLPAINHTGPAPMPQNAPKLDDCTIAKITAWVNDGAPDN